MPIWTYIVIAIWPLLGWAALAAINWRLKSSGRPRLPAAEQPGEVLARMYLWPIVCFRIWRSLVQQRKPGEPHPGGDRGGDDGV